MKDDDPEFADSSSSENDDDTDVSSVLYMVMVFLLKWQYMFNVSDNALSVLIKFLHKFILIIIKVAKTKDDITDFTKNIPTSLYVVRKRVGLSNKCFKMFSSCPTCHSINSNLDTKTCRNIQFPANPNASICNSNLLKTVKKKDRIELKPLKIYFYQPIKSSLSFNFQREGFIEAIGHWKVRLESIPDDWMADVYDGKVWKELKETGFFDSPYNLAVTLNVDWFQPYQRVKDSVGVLYLCIANLPRSLRYKQENVILVGIIPGPKEPKLTINSYLAPLVDDLKEFWTGINIMLPSGCNVIVRVCLICVSCDIPAIRKVCGFVGHQARLGCSKCLCEFSHPQGGGLQCSGSFGEWDLRNLEDHKQRSEESLQCKSQNALNKFSSKYGVRFSALLNIPYFNPVRCHVIDPMHNLLLGTSKHMLEVWVKLDLLTTSSFDIIEKAASLLSCPNDVGRLPLKIGSSFSGFTADQWKMWTLAYSAVVLKGVIPDNHLVVWLLFVRACTILCSRVLKKSDLEMAYNYLKQFCLKFIDIYGYEHFTPNMHMHMHLKDCCIDFGSIYGFWCFAFERYNGILGSFHTNNRNVESQLMKKFICQQQVFKLQFPKEFQDISDLLNLSNREKGSLKVEEVVPDTINKLNALSNYTLVELQTAFNDTLYFCIENGINLLPKVYEKVLSLEQVSHMKQFYSLLYPKHSMVHFSHFYEYSTSASLFSESYNSGSKRNSIYISLWSGNCNSSSNNFVKRVCRINYFLKHAATLSHIETSSTVSSTHILCHVSWYKTHVKADWFGQSAIVCRNELEKESLFSFIPLQRLMAPCAFGYFTLKFDSDTSETVLVAVPIPFHRCI